MKLPFFLKLNKKKPAFFLVLVLRDEKVHAVIFEEKEGKAQLVGEHEEYLKNSIDPTSSEELLDVLDRTISKAQSSLPEGYEPQKTIFGVKENWIENDKIKKEYLLKLKKVCDKLGLTPMGFLIISQAVSYLLQKEEGAPLSAILVDAGKTSVTISLVRSGRITETRSASTQDKISDTVDNLLKQFTTQETLPSRIIIFNGQKDLSFEFASHQWSKSLPFLHLPQITNLNAGFEAKAVLFGVATQMGFEVLEDGEKKAKEPEEKSPPKFENLSMENFGFVKDTDIEVDSKLPPQPKPQRKASLGINRFFLPSFPIPTISFNKGTIFIPVIILILAAGVILFYLFGIKATVLLDITPKIIRQNNSITFSTTVPADETNAIVGAKPISVSLEGEVTTSTTGKKEIGTKAKGTVTIFNNTNASKVFPKNTIITSANELNFILDHSVTVASASGDVFSGTTPGKAKVDVIAESIGTEFNLPSNTKFSIGDNPSIAAKNDESFAGGTKKEISVVSKNDIDKLLEELPKKLQQKAKEELAKQIAKDETLLPIVPTASLTKKDFDKNADDEGEKVTLKGTVVYKTLSYNKKDLISQSASLLKKNVAMGQILDENNIKIDVKDIRQKNEKEVNAHLSLEAVLKPKIDEKKLIDVITGMSYKDVQKMLMAIPQASNVSISSSLDIPFIPKTLPRISKNIKIIVSADE